MKFFKCAVYVLFFLSIINLASTLYLYNDIIKRQQVELPLDLIEMPEHQRTRESQILQSILMLHHQAGIHKPGSQPFCPTCQQARPSIVSNSQ